MLSGQACGALNGSRIQNPFDVATTLNPYKSRLLQAATTYAKQCYSSTSSFRALGCSTFVQKRLSTSVTTNASCPFDPAICKSQNSNLILDTGMLDSHKDFGLNTPADQRWQFRTRIHCAPLTTKGYTTTYNTSSDRSYTQYHYGNFPGMNATRTFSNDVTLEIHEIDRDTSARYLLT